MWSFGQRILKHKQLGSIKSKSKASKKLTPTKVKIYNKFNTKGLGIQGFSKRSSRAELVDDREFIKSVDDKKRTEEVVEKPWN